MPFDLQNFVKVGTKAELGRRIHEAWKTLDPKGQIPEPVAIANRLGELENDNHAWWSRRPLVRQAFEKVTGIPFRVLPLLRDFVTFSDFPKLRALRPREEEPLEIYQPDWFRPPRDDAKPHWIVAPPGSGRTMAAQWHRIRGTARAEEVQSLGDALELATVDTPLLVVVEGPPSERDDVVIEAMARRTVGTIIIATYEPPRREITLEGKTSRPAENPYYVEHWRLHEGWRAALVRWLVERIEERDSLLDADEMIAWLDDIDPRSETFAAPGDVVSICAIVHSTGIRSFRRRAIETFLEVRFREEAGRDHHTGIWLRAWGLELVRALAVGRLRDVSLPLSGPLPRDVWASLAPAELAPKGLTEQEIARIVGPRRMAAQEARRLLQRRSGPEAIEMLTDARVLRPHGGGLSLHPRWIGLALAREATQHEIGAGSPATWGRWAVDRERRPLIDRELDQQTIDQLQRISAAACDAFDERLLGNVGAVEAVFSAVGRRLGPAERVPDRLIEVWNVQQRLLTPRQGEKAGSCPVTRPGLERDSDWVMCCWRWSLYGPRTQVDPNLAWLFPGWCTPTLPALAPLRNMSLGEPGWGGGRDAHAETFRSLLDMADDVIRRVIDDSLPDDVPTVLVPAIMLAAHRRRWSLRRNHVEGIAGRVWSDSYMLERFATLAPADQEAVARSLWTAASAPGGDIRARTDSFRECEELRENVLRHLPTEDFEAALVTEDVKSLDVLGLLPSRLRHSLVRHVVRLNPTTAPNLSDTIDEMLWRNARRTVVIDEHDVPWMELLADAGHVRWLGRSKLWSIAPQRALERAVSTSLDTQDAADWFHSAPAHAFHELIKHVASHASVPPWAVNWLRRRVLDAGSDADLAFEAMRRAESLTC